MIVIIFTAGILCGYWLCRYRRRREIARLEKVNKFQREALHALSRSLVNAELRARLTPKLGALAPHKLAVKATKGGDLQPMRFSEN